MKVEKLFRFWLVVSAIWIFSLLILSGKRWQFPYPFEDAWEKQKFILRETWESKN